MGRRERESMGGGGKGREMDRGTERERERGGTERMTERERGGAERERDAPVSHCHPASYARCVGSVFHWYEQLHHVTVVVLTSEDHYLLPSLRTGRAC